MTPQKVEGQVVKVDAAQNKVTVRETNGTVHEFRPRRKRSRASRWVTGSRRNLREAPKCP